MIISSVFTKKSNGQSISDLLESIQSKLSDNSVVDKLFTIVAKPFWPAVEQPIRIKYDYNLAKPLSIPDKVSQVKYKSDFTDVSPIDPNTIESDGEVFRAN